MNVRRDCGVKYMKYGTGERILNPGYKRPCMVLDKLLSNCLAGSSTRIFGSWLERKEFSALRQRLKQSETFFNIALEKMLSYRDSISS